MPGPDRNSSISAGMPAGEPQQSVSGSPSGGFVPVCHGGHAACSTDRIQARIHLRCSVPKRKQLSRPQDNRSAEFVMRISGIKRSTEGALLHEAAVLMSHLLNRTSEYSHDRLPRSKKLHR
jgi:hypothetical protein